MKAVNLLVLSGTMFVISNLFAQENLPPCPKSGWRDNCYGTFVRKDGYKYVGPWYAGVPLEKGTFYNKDGYVYMPSGYEERRVWVDTIPPPAKPDAATQGIEFAKIKCRDLGFRSGTEGFGKCILQLSK